MVGIINYFQKLLGKKLKLFRYNNNPVLRESKNILLFPVLFRKKTIFESRWIFIKVLTIIFLERNFK